MVDLLGQQDVTVACGGCREFTQGAAASLRRTHRVVTGLAESECIDLGSHKGGLDNMPNRFIKELCQYPPSPLGRVGRRDPGDPDGCAWCLRQPSCLPTTCLSKMEVPDGYLVF